MTTDTCVTPYRSTDYSSRVSTLSDETTNAPDLAPTTGTVTAMSYGRMEALVQLQTTATWRDHRRTDARNSQDAQMDLVADLNLHAN